MQGKDSGLTRHPTPILAGMFFLVGPLRTGTSLMARCIDDHPSAICLCESEINRALFPGYFVSYHSLRMAAHGFALDEVFALLDQKKQDDIPSLVRWYAEVAPRLARLYAKPDCLVLGDKSPDFFKSPELVVYLASGYPLIYTVRDPRSILSSIESQSDATPEEKAERWGEFLANYRAWRPDLGRPRLLVVRYEDLVTASERTMTSVYSHLGLPYATRYREAFPRRHPSRFLWRTAIDWETGIAKDFDPGRISSWRSMTAGQLERVYGDATAMEFMQRFGYAI